MKLTRLQRESLKKVFLRTTDEPTLSLYRAFRRTVVNYGYGTVVVVALNMVIGLEPDGYTHS